MKIVSIRREAFPKNSNLNSDNGPVSSLVAPDCVSQLSAWWFQNCSNMYIPDVSVPTECIPWEEYYDNIICTECEISEYDECLLEGVFSTEDCACLFFGICSSPGGGGEYDPNIADNIQTDTSIINNFPCLDSLLTQSLPNANQEAQKLLHNVFGVSIHTNLLFKIDWALDSLNTTSAYTTPGFAAFNQASSTLHFFDTIMLNPYVVRHASKEYLIATIYHESVHAYVKFRYQQWVFGQISDSTFLNEFPLFWPNYASPLNQTERIEHETLALSYTNTIANLIKLYYNPSANASLKNQVSTSLAWEGLRETTVWKFPGVDTCKINAQNIAARNTSMIYYYGGIGTGCPAQTVRYDSLGLSLPCN